MFLKKKTFENIALHILVYIISKPISTVPGTHRFQPLVFYNLTQTYVSIPLSVTHQKCHCSCHLMLTVFIRMLCSDLAEKTGMAKRKGASDDLSLKLTLASVRQEVYE